MKKIIFVLALSALLTSCGTQITPDDDNYNNNNQDNDDKNSNEKLLNFNAPNYETRKINSIDEVTSDDLFNIGNTVDISISISDEELNKLQDDYETGYKNDTYHVADSVTINLTNYEQTFTWNFNNVGIRQKGNTSRKDILKNGEINTKNHFKLSFDETFDDVEKYSTSFIEEMKTKMDGEGYSEREFLGLDGLDFKWNRNEDTTYIKEIYCSYIYKAGGIIAQRIGLSTLSMIQKDNDNKSYSFGLCTIYEPAKKQLIKKSFQDNDKYLNAPTWKEEKKGTFGIENVNYGDLYKCTWGVGEGSSNTGSSLTSGSISNKKIGIANISGSYIPTYERKTNTDITTYTDTQLKNAVNTFENSTYSDIEKIVDLEYLSKLSAINYIIGNPDDYRYNYNNYMIYFRRVDGKMMIIPIDNDRVLGITKGMNFENGNTSSKPFSTSSFAGNQINPLLLKTILSSDSNKSKTNYVDVIKSLLSSDWSKHSTFDQYMNKAMNSYTNYTFNTSNENMSFKDYINKKTNTVNKELSTNFDVEDTKDTTIYDNLYIVGNFNDWGNYSDEDKTKYKFNYLENYNYSVTINIEKELSNNTLEFKINGGKQDYSTIDWSFDSELTTLIKDKTNNAKLNNVYKGDSIKIDINTNTLVTSVTKL